MNPYKTSISLRLDDAFRAVAFRAVAAGIVNVPNPAQLRALAHPDQNRPVSVHLTSTHREGPHTGRVSSAAYKPTHGGYPSAGARA